jgi:hypothetical protein
LFKKEDKKGSKQENEEEKKVKETETTMLQYKELKGKRGFQYAWEVINIFKYYKQFRN